MTLANGSRSTTTSYGVTDMRRTICSVLIAVVLFNTATPVYAQWTVVDPTNLVQNVQQVKQALESVRKLTTQIQTAKSQLESLTGDRGMRKLVTDVTRNYIPKDWRETLDGMGAEGSKIKNMVDDIRRNVGDIGSMNLKFATGKVTAELERSAKYDLEAYGRASTLYNRSNERFGELEKLGDALNGAKDMKAVVDLMARLQLESTMLLNELLRMMSEMIATDRERTIFREQKQQGEYARAINGL